MAVVSLEAQPPPAANNKTDFNTDYLRTPPAVLRITEGAISLLALICFADGYCDYDSGRNVFLLFVVVLTMVKAALIVIFYVLRLEEKITVINVPLSLLLNDAITLIIFFIMSTIALLSIGRCESSKVARMFGAIFTVLIFIVIVGLNYFNYLAWEERRTKELEQNGGGTTITQSSPTVLT